MVNSIEKVFSDFRLVEKVSKKTIDQYKNKVGKGVIDIWEKYGFGTAFNGYIKIINPNNLNELLKETYNKIIGEIPVFVTGMGDIIVCDNEGGFEIIDYRHQRCDVLWSDYEIEWEFFLEDYYLTNKFNWYPYLEAVKKYGDLEYDECFGYETLLSLGGEESITNLKKVNYLVHINIMSQLQGMISF